MSKTNISLTIILALLSGMTIRLQQRVAQTRAWNQRLAPLVSQPDPRPVAAQQEQELVVAWNNLNTSLLTLQRTMPSIDPASAVRPIPDARGPRPAASAVGDDVNALFAKTLDRPGIALLQQLVDPQIHALPRRVLVFEEAIPEWIALRARWPNPVVIQELTPYQRMSGLEQDLLQLLDPRNKEHQDCVAEWLRTGRLQIRDYLDWYRDSKISGSQPQDFNSLWGLARMLECHAQTIDSSADIRAAKMFMSNVNRWIQQSTSSAPSCNVSLAFVSGVHHQRAWESLEQLAESNRDQNFLRRLAGFAYWHRHRVGTGSELLFDRLQSNRYLPEDLKQPAPAVTATSDVAPELLDKSLDDALDSMLMQIEFIAADANARDSLYRRVAGLAPDDRLRPKVMQHLLQFQPTEESTRQWQQALWCRWADRRDEAALYREATVVTRERVSIDAPDITAEAIRTLCRFDSDRLSDLARYWLDKGRWSQSISAAWEAGGEAAELALCEALFAVNVSDPAAGTQSALGVLAAIGKRATLRTMRVLDEAIRLPDAPNVVLLRFTKLAQSKALRRVAQEESR